MSQLAAFWLVLLHVIAGAVAAPLRPAPATGVGGHQIAMEHRAPEATASTTRTPAEALRAARAVGSTVVARPGERPPMGGDGSWHAVAAPAGHARTAATTRPQQVAGDSSHRLPSRGSLLPYFPTAPPRPA